MNKDDSIADICLRIARIREQHAGPRGKASFARELGISPSTYDYYESKRVPPADLLLRISELTSVDMMWLLTGKTSAKADIEIGGPLLNKLARLLSMYPQCESAVASFIEALERVAVSDSGRADGVATHRSDGTEAPGRSSSGQQPAAGGAAEATAVSDGTSGQSSGLESLQAGSVSASATELPDPRTSSDSSASSLVAGFVPVGGLKDRRGEVVGVPVSHHDVPGEHQGWIPVLGRSAAGVPHFWADVPGIGEEAGQGDRGNITMLADLVAAMKPRKARQVRPAKAAGELSPGGRVQLVLLDAPETPGTAEFVIAEHIADHYRDLFAVRIDGESMDPEVCHGDVVILSPHCPAEQGCAAVIQLADQIGVTCKLVRYDGSMMHLIPVNEAFGPTVHHVNSVSWALKVIASVRPL